MVPALILFALTYLLMLALPQHRPFAALGGALLFVLPGAAGWWEFLPPFAFSNCSLMQKTTLKQSIMTNF